MWNETYFMLSVFCALLVFMVDYSFGQPGNEKWNDKELLSGWSLFLAKRRLKKDGLLESYERQLSQNLLMAENKQQRKLFISNFNRLVFDQAKSDFYFEKALGMCPICFHFWVALFFYLMVNIFYFSVNNFTFTFYFLLSHFFIRLLKKFL